MLKIEEQLAKMAKRALWEELITYPKPGLVSHIDNGSHTDMNYTTFINSINSLTNYFMAIAKAGGLKQDFAYLKSLGLKAEQQMLRATKNVNTHRGAIFVLGILVAATAYCKKHYLSFEQIRKTIISLYGKSLKEHQTFIGSHGSQARNNSPLESIIDSASNGFPLLFAILKQFEQYILNYDYNFAKLKTFFVIMHNLDDTNLVYRGGIDGLNYAKFKAGQILKVKKVNLFKLQALNLHQKFIYRNLSPGGCADILAAIIFLFKVKKIWV